MARRIVKQTSFTAGEISPRLYSRADTSEYGSGLKTATNALVLPHGPVRRRNGSKYIAEVKDSSEAVKLVRYQFSKDTAFILEFGNLYIRFYTSSGQVTESNVSISGITQANPGVVTTSSAHGFSNGDQVYITGVVGMTEVNNTSKPYIVANKTSTTFELQDIDAVNVNTTGYTAYSSGGVCNRIYTVTSPWDDTEVQNLQYIQSGSTMYIVHPDHAPRQLVYTSSTSWALSTVEFLPPPTYESGYDPNVTLKPLATTGVDKSFLAGAVDLTDGSTYKWTASGSGTNEYYVDLFAGGDPGISTPLAVVENLSVMTEGTVGSLSAGEYDYGDNDTLGYSTIYVRLTDGADPDSKASEFVSYSETSVFLEGDVGRQILNEATSETGRASITSITNAALAVTDIVEDFTDTNTIAAGDWKMDLSPVVDLEVDGIQAGAIVNIRSEYPSGSLGNRLTITNVTSASPGVVTSAAHGLSDGQSVQIQDIVGMTQINDKIFTVDNVTTNTFELKGENTTGYTTYASGGIARQVLTDEAIDAFRSDDVGKYILINGGVAQIITVNAADDVDAEILKSLNSDDATGNWTLETDTWTSTRGYPRAVGLFEQRLIFGGTTAQPQNIWMSEVGIFDGFGTGPDDEDALDIELVSNQVNEINWIAASRDLVVGTSGGELTINSGSSTSITPSSVQQKPRTYHGSSRQQVATVKEEILFIQNSSRKIRTFRYDFNLDGYTGEDLNFLAEHITEGGLEELAYAQEPDTLIYAATTNGDMLVGTYDRTKKIIAWTKYETDGTYENVQTISSSTEDQVWVVVKRTIDSTTRRYIELFDNSNGVDDLDGFSDSYLTLSNNIAISGITTANPGVVTTSSAHSLSNGDTVIIKDLVDPATADLDSAKTNMSSLNGGTYTVANKTSTTFELSGINTTNYNSYGSSGNVWEKVTAISGLDHLEGKTVQIKVDGASHPTKTVSSGAIALDNAGGEVVIGLPYTTTIQTLDIEFDVGEGSSQGQRARWVRPLLQVYRSTNPTVNGEFLPARSGDDLMDQKVPLYSGYLEYGNLSWSNGTSLTIALSSPFPLQLSGISGSTNSGVK